jgi:hypothetical protein
MLLTTIWIGLAGALLIFLIAVLWDRGRFFVPSGASPAAEAFRRSSSLRCSSETKSYHACLMLACR